MFIIIFCVALKITVYM